MTADDGIDLASIHVADRVDAERIKAALTPPSRGIVQAEPKNIPESVLPLLRQTVAAEGLFLSVTTTCAYGCDLAALLMAGVTAWGGLTPERAKSVELAVHEALANAILHGNLAVDNALRDSLEGLAAYARQLTERLADPAYAQRPVTVRATWDETLLTIAVTDSGVGYAQASTTGPNAKTGRGLSLIADSTQSIEAADGGRTLIMRFAR